VLDAVGAAVEALENLGDQLRRGRSN
jgi:hypothetical protein